MSHTVLRRFSGLSLKRSGQSIGMGLCLAVMAGCAVTPGFSDNDAKRTDIADMRGASALGKDISTFLDNATSGSSASFAESPWGRDVSVVVEESYYAASGHNCMHLNVSQSGAQGSARQAQVACHAQGDHWYAQRLVTESLDRSRTAQ